MRLEFEPNSSNTAAAFVEKDVVPAHDAASEVEKMFREGVKAAQEGKRAEARSLLLRVTEADADNENAWLWLASISEYPEELLVFLNNVLRINPHNERALEWNKATQSLLAKTLVQRGMDAARDDRRDFARQCFEQALEHEAENEMAWLWMASVVESEDEKAACFERVLSVNPENDTARVSLAAIESQKTRKLFRDALATAFDGRHDEAKEMLAAVLSRDAQIEDAWVLRAHLANSFEERAESLLKVRALNPDNEMAKANLASWRMLSEQLAAEAVETEESEEKAYFDETVADAHGAEQQREPAADFDAPTQDLSFEAGFGQTEAASYDAPEADFEAPEPAEERDEKSEAADEVRFDSDEDQEAAEDKLKAELEAEEAEMHWAFSVAPEPREAEDYFRDDASDDIHKTQQANYDTEYFSQGFESEAENEENVAEHDDDARREEWRNTSPTVFVNYSPSAPDDSPETQTVQFSYAENPVGEQSMPEADVPQLSFDEDFAPEQPAEEPAEEPLVMTNAAEPAEEMFAETSSMPKSETVLCPFCDAQNEKQAFSCASCQTVLTLSDLEMLLNQHAANTEKLRQSVESLERENESYGLSAEQMTNLGVGHVNLKNYRQGFFYLQEAVRMNPSNVLLDAQVNALAIRLSEMEEQQNAHDLLSKNRKILVVDDSPTVRKLISGKLEKCGHEVVCAIDGVDALEKIKELKPDLVLLDITMPRMDGYQVCKMIRSNDTTKDVPVVMISGKDGFFDKVRGRMAGTSGYITKPFGPETLMKTVETYLN